MLTELDTSQIIRSYIGVELAEVDGSMSTSDDLASGLASNRDFNSELDVSSSSDDDDDDISLHIRDEACQTGDDAADNPAAESSRTAGCFRMPRDQRMKSGRGVIIPVEEDVSVWRTLLHSDDSYNDVDYDVVKYKVPGRPSRAGQSVDFAGKSLGGVADGGGVMSILLSSDESTDTASEGCSVVLRRPVRSQSDSSLLASVAGTASRISRSVSVPCVVTDLKPELSDLEGSEMDNPTRPAEEVAGTTGTSELELANVTTAAASMLIERHLECYVEEETAVVGMSDITLEIQSELAEDAVSTAASGVTTSLDTCLPNPAAEVAKSQPERDDLCVRSDVIHRPRVACMDHQVCGMLADFVAHL